MYWQIVLRAFLGARSRPESRRSSVIYAVYWRPEAETFCRNEIGGYDHVLDFLIDLCETL
jgi:hypothetical protein